MIKYKMIQAGKETIITKGKAIEIIGSQEDYKIAREGNSFITDDIEIIFKKLDKKNICYELIGRCADCDSDDNVCEVMQIKISETETKYICNGCINSYDYDVDTKIHTDRGFFK